MSLTIPGPGSPDLESRLRLALDPGLAQALGMLWALLPEARLVGGVVRDLIAGAPIADIDLGVPAPPERVMQRLVDAGIRVVPTGLAHGTLTALVGGHAFEITSLRRDEQTDGRHALVAWTDDWREDAARRDFTINAMSLSRTHVLFDDFGGLDDLQAGRVRFVGDAARRIEEDALRILRFFRFRARFGAGEADRSAIAAIRAAIPRLQRLSAERVWSELERVLTGPQLAPTLMLMSDLGVLAALLPGGSDPMLLARLVEVGLPRDAILRLAALVQVPDAAARCLRLSNADAARLAALRQGTVPDPAMDDAALRRLLADETAEILAGRTWLAPYAPAEGALLRARIGGLPRPEFPLAGRDLLALGLPPGRPLGALLAQARAWWRDGGCVAGRQECLDQLAASGAIIPPILSPDRPTC